MSKVIEDFNSKSFRFNFNMNTDISISAEKYPPNSVE